MTELECAVCERPLPDNHVTLCPEKPELLEGMPIGMYHCNYCGEMQLAGTPHLPTCDVCLMERNPALEDYIARGRWRAHITNDNSDSQSYVMVPAPADQIYVCAACGKTSPTIAPTEGSDAGWDESCAIHCVLCYTEKNEDGRWVAVVGGSE